MKEQFAYKFDELLNPTLKAFHNLGGSGSVSEVEEQVALILNLTDDQVNEIHRGNTTKLRYRLAWAKNYLKHFGVLENSARGIWALTEEGFKTSVVDKDIVKKKVFDEIKKQSTSKEKTESKNILSIDEFLPTDDNEEIENISWQEKIIEKLQSISPQSFERLCQRLLRELGFQNVEVTGQANDGGIDGKGNLQLGGVLSFNVIFQAKRYKGSVSPSIVRDFRGAMIGRADKGLIITTGTFTREAKKEAQRDGAPPIDLMDGNNLAEKLRDLRLGIDVELVEKIIIKEEWFNVL